MTPEQASLRGRLGAAMQQAKHDPREYTKPARQAAWQRFLDEVDPNKELPEPERIRRAEAARKAHMYRAALKSAATRSAKAQRGPRV